MTTMLPQPMDRDLFCSLFKETIEKSTGAHNTAVRFIGHTLFMNIKSNPRKILDSIFVPLLDHRPRWECRGDGWYHVFINHMTFPEYYSDLLTKINKPNEVENKKLNRKIYAGSGR